MPKAITYIDLFSGIGGFREGLSRAGGFVCVGHCVSPFLPLQFYVWSLLFAGMNHLFFKSESKFITQDIADF